MSGSGDVPTAMSTSALESKLRDLKEKSNKHSQVLTAKLASSQSGQDLLHIGTSLSTLPPDLHSLLTQLHPVLSAAESTEKQYLQHLQKLVKCGNEIRSEQRRVDHAKECADLYLDLMAAESVVKRDAAYRRSTLGLSSSNPEEGTSESPPDKVDHASSLERCAHTTLCLVQDLQSSTEKISAMMASKVMPNDSANALPSMLTPLEEDTERAQFLMKLAPRIRRLESDTIISLTHRMEQTLKRLQQRREGRLDAQEDDKLPQEEELLLMIGHCMRGLAFLGRGKEVENVFARVAIMPLIRSKFSMGSLDEGGARGECAGLYSLLDNITASIEQSFGPVLRSAEVMFDVGPKMEIDLVTSGVWVPIATALMADAGIKMAIFSPGIASILQANYLALDTFLSELAQRLLKEPSEEPEENVGAAESLYFRPHISRERVQRAQDRIYLHSKTAEFSKRWNLPIYYQLRFGECCNRLNKAVDDTKQGGWITEVFTGKDGEAEFLRNELGFELSFFLELYDILLRLWKPDVILRPLTNRFLRGAVQLVGRSVKFIQNGMDGQVMFGVEKKVDEDVNANVTTLPYPTRSPYCWGDSAQDVAAIAWELAILETSIAHDYVSTVCDAVGNADSTKAEREELRGLVSAVLREASDQIQPVVDKAWNEVIVKILTEKCSGPLAAVKGVAATYRMTNRPPPTQASSFVVTILRPLKEFCEEFSNRTPDYIGVKWKSSIVSSVTERYGIAVEELITTVQRTEVTLQNRRTKRAASGGMSDGDKVKLQLYLDIQAFSRHIEEVGIDVSSVDAMRKLRTLTEQAESLLTQNGS